MSFILDLLSVSKFVLTNLSLFANSEVSLEEENEEEEEWQSVQ